MDFIDLRSDTVTHPTPAMRKAMAEAVVGDDVYGEDPTVNRLEEITAERLGKEAALFVPSGTMGNLIAILAQCDRGDEIILGDLSHIFLYTAGGVSALGGVHVHTLKNRRDGTLLLDDIQRAIRDDDPHLPRTKMIVLENTHNRCGGAPIPLDYARQVSALAKQHGLLVHLDGARIFNAAVALGVSVAELSDPVDSVMFCLSKGLCAPVGSVVCGSKAFIYRARRIRKQVGGGMRQAGVLAAAGIVALNEIVGQLHVDHARAQRLAESLQQIPGLMLRYGEPLTNMIYLEIESQVRSDAREIAIALDRIGIKVGIVGDRCMRLVTHHWVTDEAVDRTHAAFQEVIHPMI